MFSLCLSCHLVVRNQTILEISTALGLLLLAEQELELHSYVMNSVNAGERLLDDE